MIPLMIFFLFITIFGVAMFRVDRGAPRRGGLPVEMRIKSKISRIVTHRDRSNPQGKMNYRRGDVS